MKTNFRKKTINTLYKLTKQRFEFTKAQIIRIELIKYRNFFA